jgi:hypothetical protein
VHGHERPGPFPLRAAARPCSAPSGSPWSRWSPPPCRPPPSPRPTPRAYSHYNGYKLDFSRLSCLSSYVYNNFAYIGVRGDGAPQYRSGAGNIYADEGNHWDVTFYNCGGC